MKDTPVFAALGDATRRDLLVNLAKNSPKTASQLAEEYPMSRQGILKHLDILENAGLVATRKEGREKLYTLTLEPLSELETWIQELGAIWDTRLMRLKNFLESDDGNEPQ